MFFPSFSREGEFDALQWNRRKWLGMAGLGLGGVVLGGGSTVEAASGNSGVRPSAEPIQISPEWLEREGSAVRSYALYLASIRLRSMNVGQLIAAHAKQRGTIWNTLPPRNAWPAIVSTLRVVDTVAAYLRMPVREVVSVYRAPSYNARCEGARSGSWHTRNVAVDIKMAASPSVVAGVARALRARGLFRGGVGSYGSFVHIDTRGENIDW